MTDQELRAGVSVRFGTLSAANDWRDGHSKHLHPEDTRRTKTVKLHPEAEGGIEVDAEQSALISKADETESYGQEKLTDDERATLDARDGWTWNDHGMGAMHAKAALQANGATDWLNYYEKGEGASGALKTLEQGKEAQAETGAGTGIGGDYDGTETTEGERARKTEQAEGHRCGRAKDGCRHGEPEACQVLREDCGLSEGRVADLLGTDVEHVEADDDATPATWEDVDGAKKGALSRAWKGYKAAVQDLEGDLAAAESQLARAERAADSIRAIETEVGLEPTESFGALREHHEHLGRIAADHAGADHGQPGDTPAEGGEAGDATANPQGETPEETASEPKPAERVGYDALPSGFPAKMGRLYLTYATMRGDVVERVRYTDPDVRVGVQITHHPDRGVWTVCRHQATNGEWRPREEYDSLHGAVGKGSHMARDEYGLRSGQLPKVSQAADDPDEWPVAKVSGSPDTTPDGPGRWKANGGGERRTKWKLNRGNRFRGGSLRIVARHLPRGKTGATGVVRLVMERYRKEGGGYKGKQSIQVAKLPDDGPSRRDETEYRRTVRAAAVKVMETFPAGPPADVLTGWQGPLEVVDGGSMGDDDPVTVWRRDTEAGDVEEPDAGLSIGDRVTLPDDAEHDTGTIIGASTPAGRESALYKVSLGAPDNGEREVFREDDLAEPPADDRNTAPGGSASTSDESPPVAGHAEAAEQPAFPADLEAETETATNPSEKARDRLAEAVADVDPTTWGRHVRDAELHPTAPHYTLTVDSATDYGPRLTLSYDNQANDWTTSTSGDHGQTFQRHRDDVAAGLRLLREGADRLGDNQPPFPPTGRSGDDDPDPPGVGIEDVGDQPAFPGRRPEAPEAVGAYTLKRGFGNETPGAPGTATYTGRGEVVRVFPHGTGNGWGAYRTDEVGDSRNDGDGLAKTTTQAEALEAAVDYMASQPEQASVGIEDVGDQPAFHVDPADALAGDATPWEERLEAYEEGINPHRDMPVGERYREFMESGSGPSRDDAHKWAREMQKANREPSGSDAKTTRRQRERAEPWRDFSFPKQVDGIELWERDAVREDTVVYEVSNRQHHTVSVRRESNHNRGWAYFVVDENPGPMWVRTYSRKYAVDVLKRRLTGAYRTGDEDMAPGDVRDAEKHVHKMAAVPEPGEEPDAADAPLSLESETTTTEVAGIEEAADEPAFPRDPGDPARQYEQVGAWYLTTDTEARIELTQGDDGVGLVAINEGAAWLVYYRDDGGMHAPLLGHGLPWYAETRAEAMETLRDRAEELPADQVRLRARTQRTDLSPGDVRSATSNAVKGKPAERVAMYFETVAEAATAPAEALEAIDGVGPSTIESLREQAPDQSGIGIEDVGEQPAFPADLEADDRADVAGHEAAAEQPAFPSDMETRPPWHPGIQRNHTLALEGMPYPDPEAGDRIRFRYRDEKEVGAGRTEVLATVSEVKDHDVAPSLVAEGDRGNSWRMHFGQAGGQVARAPAANGTYVVRGDLVGFDLMAEAGAVGMTEQTRNREDAPDQAGFEAFEQAADDAAEDVIETSDQETLGGEQADPQATFADAPADVEEPDEEADRLEEEQASTFGVDDRDDASRGGANDTVETEEQTLGEATGTTDVPEAGQGGLSDYGEERDDLAGRYDDEDGGEGNASRGVTSAVASPVRVCMTTTGSRQVEAAVTRSDATLGYESGETEPLEEHPVGFVDYPFRDDDAGFADHLEAVQRHEPALAVAPDLDHDREPGAVYEQADRLAEHAGTVIVVPKREDVPPTDVPDRFRVGIPSADGFGDGTPWRMEAFREAGDVHLLGGSFTSHLEADKHVDVASVDTSSAENAASSYWTYWTGEADSPSWPKAPDSADLYEIMEVSLDNAVRAWRERHGETVEYLGERELRDDDPTNAVGYGRPPATSADLWHPDDAERVEEVAEWDREQVAAVREAAADMEDTTV